MITSSGVRQAANGKAFFQQKFDFRCSGHSAANGRISTASAIAVGCRTPKIASTRSGREAGRAETIYLLM
jgi:hypothetical protein